MVILSVLLLQKTLLRIILDQWSSRLDILFHIDKLFGALSDKVEVLN